MKESILACGCVCGAREDDTRFAAWEGPSKEKEEVPFSWDLRDEPLGDSSAIYRDGEAWRRIRCRGGNQESPLGYIKDRTYTNMEK